MNISILQTSDWSEFMRLHYSAYMFLVKACNKREYEYLSRQDFNKLAHGEKQRFAELETIKDTW
jgi:hypothetical protein